MTWGVLGAGAGCADGVDPVRGRAAACALAAAPGASRFWERNHAMLSPAASTATPATAQGAS